MILVANPIEARLQDQYPPPLFWARFSADLRIIFPVMPRSIWFNLGDEVCDQNSEDLSRGEFTANKIFLSEKEQQRLGELLPVNTKISSDRTP